MIDPSEIDGKRLAMIAWAKKFDGSDDVVVFSGLAEWNGVALTMAREAGPSIEIPAEWLVRLKPVEPHLRTMLLNAEYCFSVSVGDLGPKDDRSAFRQTGLKWPGDDRAG